MRVEPFGESSLGPVQLLTIGAEPGPVLEVLDLGATVHRLWVTCGDGVRRNVVLGHPDAEDHLTRSGHLGSTIGRYANRIAGGRFTLDGQVVQLPTNDRGNTLHGGSEGFGRRIWDVLDHGDEHVVLRLVSPDGDQGFPGRLAARGAFRDRRRTVKVLFRANSDAPTVVCLTSHAYFKLTVPAPSRTTRCESMPRSSCPSTRPASRWPSVSAGRHGVRPARAHAARRPHPGPPPAMAAGDRSLLRPGRLWKATRGHARLGRQPDAARAEHGPARAAGVHGQRLRRHRPVAEPVASTSTGPASRSSPSCSRTLRTVPSPETAVLVPGSYQAALGWRFSALGADGPEPARATL